MRDWQRDAPRIIAEIHKAMPDATPDELRKALRSESSQFAMGTSWGKKVWAKHCKTYLTRMTGGSTKSKPATVWPADICFPFRERTDLA